MADRLRDKVAIVTGAGSRGPGFGTGKAISVLFAREGARICLVDLDATRAEETLELVRSEGGEAVVAEGDVSSAVDCERIVEHTVSRYARLDVLVNNVGIVPLSAPVHEVDEAEWDRVMSVNLKSVLLMTRSALPRMIASGGGSIINISSTGALMSSGKTPAYGASKAAMIRLTADTAVGYGAQGIRANTIAPGQIYTPLVAPLLTPEAREERRKASPLGIEGTAWDVAWTAVFLASDESRFVTATCIPVDGGLTQAAR